jgi:hypothetical protein
MCMSYLVHALESEMLGREWEVPAPLHEGLNVNALQESLDSALDQSLRKGKLESGDALVTYKDVTRLCYYSDRSHVRTLAFVGEVVARRSR